MKKILVVISLLFLLLACAKPQEEQKIKNDAQKMNSNQKVLVVFFSKTGENYGVGNITVGNTHKVAAEIARQTNGTLFEIKPVVEYPIGYKDCVSVAKEEKAKKARPAIKNRVENITDYDVIYLGYPNWGNDAPMPVYTFLENHNLNNKQVYPFVTHEGSGIGNSIDLLKQAFPKLIFNEGLAMYGHIAQSDAPFVEKTVKNWLNK